MAKGPLSLSLSLFVVAVCASFPTSSLLLLLSARSRLCSRVRNSKLAVCTLMRVRCATRRGRATPIHGLRWGGESCRQAYSTYKGAGGLVTVVVREDAPSQFI